MAPLRGYHPIPNRNAGYEICQFPGRAIVDHSDMSTIPANSRRDQKFLPDEHTHLIDRRFLSA